MIFLNSNDELQFKFLEYFEMSITKFWKIYSTVIDVKTTIFFDEEFTSANAAAGLDDLSLNDSLGLATQIGADRSR